ncbi:MAG: MBOAT family O-acyltransferase, partial [Flavobacteriales bacterium]
AEFWRRWHISLSSWFRDYLYIPLGGSRLGRWMSLRNTAVIFLVSGLWHGANWTFVAWGGLHALYFAPLLLLQRNRRHLDSVAEGRWLPSPREALAMGTTFALVCFAWIFFRAESLGHAWACIKGLASHSLFSLPERVSKTWLAFLAGFLAVEWAGRNDAFGLQRIGVRWPRWGRWALYYAILIAIFRFAGKSADFIYFQF